MLFFSGSAHFRYIFNNIVFLGISYSILIFVVTLVFLIPMIGCLCFLSFFFFFKSYSKKVDCIKKWLVKYSHYAINITLLPTQNCFQRQTENKRYILLRINPSICRTLFFIIIASFQGLPLLFYNLQKISCEQ